MQGLEIPAVIAGVVILLTVLWDTFETMVLPRSAGPGLRVTRFYFIAMWTMWRFLATRFKYMNPFRQGLLGIYGPFALIVLISLWANLLIIGFGLIIYGIGANEAERVGIKPGEFADYLYLSGVTLFTLGYGDKTPGVPLTKALCVLEAGVGFGLLAMVIGYLPTLYQTFARRENMVLRLYARTGHPATAHKLVERYAEVGAWAALETLLLEWEQWGAEMLESHRSYPIMAFYRSQIEEDSWLATAVILCNVYEVVQQKCPNDAKERGSLLLQAGATRQIIEDGLADLTAIIRLKGDESPAQKLSRYLLLALPPNVPACPNEERDDSLVE